MIGGPNRLPCKEVDKDEFDVWTNLGKNESMEVKADISELQSMYKEISQADFITVNAKVPFETDFGYSAEIVPGIYEIIDESFVILQIIRILL